MLLLGGIEENEGFWVDFRKVVCCDAGTREVVTLEVFGFGTLGRVGSNSLSSEAKPACLGDLCLDSKIKIGPLLRFSAASREGARGGAAMVPV